MILVIDKVAKVVKKDEFLPDTTHYTYNSYPALTIGALTETVYVESVVKDKYMNDDNVSSDAYAKKFLYIATDSNGKVIARSI